MSQPNETSAREDVVIAVMGATGSGKSTFIKLVTQRQDIKIGDTLSSETDCVCSYNFTHEGVKYVLVDTPGYDDSSRPDSEITNSILTWCRDSLVSGQKLNGIIYTHRISDTRMGGSALRNLRMFRKLVGTSAFQNVVLATTFLEAISGAVRDAREKELQDNPDYWGAMRAKGARMVQLERANRATGLAVLQDIATNGKIILHAQDQIVNQGKAIAETDAAKEQTAQLDELAKKLEALRIAKEDELAEAERQQSLRAAEARQQAELEMKRKLEEERRLTEAARIRVQQEAQAEFERQRWQLLMQQQREEQYREQLRELERQQAVEIQRQQAVETERKRQAEVARREKYQREYCCRGYRPKWPCDDCGKDVTRMTHYYRISSAEDAATIAGRTSILT
ncbi:P-loop containing nucleoside triphosphate hydrolase protein [Podospora didyma]|uniref:P-loop containing nucleoside triphosphate hydrolase protein n=1 Tax=Podospora didyma TaxID=330526 RepID=A0AAE0NFZ6_9PEZI|nr:P-loop containing nucleoside triphosphate hydrolase protein [Podospora didyma]